MNEPNLLNLINKKLNLSLKSTKRDQYCPYDAYDDKYTVELKCRRKHYTTQLIEKHKVNSLHKGKELLYAVSTPKGVYCFNVSNLINDNYEFEWETRRLPATTDFGRTNWVDKEVGYIHIEEAFWRDENDSTN